MPGPDAPNTPGSSSLARGVVAPAVFLAAAIPLIAINLRRGRGQFDQEFFHAPSIWTFASQWPRFDFSDYLSATTPGYHVFMATVVKFITSSMTGAKLISALFTVALLAILERAVAHRLDRDSPRWLPVLLVAPFLASMYVFFPGVWLQPDNPGWLGVLIILLLALRGRFDGLMLIGGGLTLLLLVLVRQSHIWAAGLLWLGAWWSDPYAGAPLFRLDRQRIVRAIIAIAAAFPAIATLVFFMRVWGGLTPPRFQLQHASGFNPATPAFFLSLAGMFAPFFAVWIEAGLRVLVRSGMGRMIVVSSVAFGVVLATIPETTYLYEPRSSGLWNLVRAFEPRFTIAGHTSPLILVLAPIGAVSLAALLALNPFRERWILGLGLLGFVAAQTANANAWQRYLEPFLLMVLALAAARAAAPTRRAMLPWGPAALAVLQALLTAYTLWSEPIVVKTW